MKKVLIYTTLLIVVLLGIGFVVSLVSHWDDYWAILNYKFVDRENLQVSIMKIVKVVGLFMLFAYLNKQSINLLHRHFMSQNPDSAASKTVMAKNVVQVFVWGLWLLLSLAILHISVQWLIAITGGLSTGIGFASKNIIENIFYGLSLMTGRMKVGDWIEVNNTTGRVTNISYTSTVVESLYGEVITFQNSQLFTYNYKNLTRNHRYVLAVVYYSVAYGSDLQQVINVVEEATNKLKKSWMDPSKKIVSVVGELGDSGVNMKLFVWVTAPKLSSMTSEVLSCIYDTLKANNISIPFPQRDIHIVKN
jgi:small-conductance mechanosensitive channel